MLDGHERASGASGLHRESELGRGLQSGSVCLGQEGPLLPFTLQALSQNRFDGIVAV